MVSSALPIASQIGIDILKKGGNAYDAAVAVQFALAVVYPRAGNIAGGGFAVYRTNDGQIGALDFREKAPLAAYRDMFLDEKNEVVKGHSTKHALSTAVPGTVDGMWQLHQKFGSLPWTELIQPSISLAQNGFLLTEKEANKLAQYQDEFLEANGPSFVFYKEDNWKKNDKIQLEQLAKTLGRIAENGRDEFYIGETSEIFLKEIESRGGVISQEDLNKYASVWREAITGKYKEHKIITMSPPSSGGIALLQLLKGVSAYDLDMMDHNSVEYIHLLTELERRVYADRSSHLGDNDFYDVPDEMLLNEEYIRERNGTIEFHKKTDSQDIKEGEVEVIESIETTHFSIVDKDRNAIALTTTLNGNYGSKIFVKEGGFFLNNQMDDFSIKPGYANQYGLVGAEANAIEPEKRMLSSMTPTIIEKEGELFMLLGTPGGATIITSVFQTILNVIDHEMDLQEAIDAKKTHHQWLPDRILYEKNGLDIATINGLKDLGHVIEERMPIGKIDAVLVNEKGMLVGGADKRGDDAAIGY